MRKHSPAAVARSEGAPAAATNRDAEAALVAALADVLQASMNERLAHMFEKADELLVEQAMLAKTSEERRSYSDAVRGLNTHRAAITRRVLKEIGKKFGKNRSDSDSESTNTFNFDELTLQEDEALEGNIAVTNQANKAELLYESQLWELRQRLAWWKGQDRPGLTENALFPAALSRAFFDATRLLEADLATRLIVFKMFDRLVVTKMDAVYSRLITTFDEHKVFPIKVRAKETAIAPRGSPHAPPRNTTGDVVIDEQTWQMLQQLGSLSGPIGAPGEPVATDGAPGSYSDASLASDLSALVQGQDVPGWPGAGKEQFGKRAHAVGQVFNEILGDRQLPDFLKPAFNNLRFAVVKTALADPDFFTNPRHPVRGLVDELAAMAAIARTSTPAEIERMAKMLAEVHQQFAVSAQEVRQASQSSELVSDSSFERFLDDQRQAQARRREQIISKSRRVVTEELWLRTAGRNVPSGLRQVLSHGWVPMMALRLLRQGINGRHWHRGLNALERILDAVDRPPGELLADATRDDLIADVERDLRSVGMVPARVSQLSYELRQALNEQTGTEEPVLPADPFAKTKPPAPDAIDEGLTELGSEVLVEDIVLPGSWFEVYDHGSDTVRWMKATAIHGATGKLEFAEFNGKNPISIDVNAFIDDLSRGLSAPVNPSPMVRSALQGLTGIMSAD